MCGIVAYFGEAENPLTRILTGMWSIIYRAPDSTGVAVFGDETTPVRTRKALGSVQELVEVLNDRPLSLRSGEQLAGLLADPGHFHGELREARRRLLALEGLSQDCLEETQRDPSLYPSWAELTDPGRRGFLEPGMVGRPGPRSEFVLYSRKDFRRTIETLMFEHDLPPLVVKSVFHRFLSRTLQKMDETDGLPMAEQDVVAEFDRLFEAVTDYESAPRHETDVGPGSQEEGVPPRSASRVLWRALVNKSIHLPADYDPDGVRRLFSCLDCLVMTRMSSRTNLDERVHREMTRIFQQSGIAVPAPWQTLYRAERALNVYGMAAAAVYMVLVADRQSLAGPAAVSAIEVPGRTDPHFLASLVQPVLAHGRWALQSEVTLKNTHPFVDQQRMRSACINGQFSTEVERRVYQFLTKVAGISLRSENSTEYFVQLWGYYARILSEEKTRNESIRQQVSLGLDDLAAGSHNIDYQIFYRLRHANAEEIEEMAFIRAMQVMIQDGGQVAVAGMSLLSPHRLFAASHNRPLFIVQRKNAGGVMLVSDVNAALGLFSQRQIQKSARKLKNSHPAKEVLLKQFEVMVTPLQGEELFACVESRPTSEAVSYQVRIADFYGREQSDIEPFYTRISPVQIKRSLNRTFYETHLREIPGLIEELVELYLPASQIPELERFGVNRRLLKRRFGAGLSSLSRIFLVGMGSSYHAAGMAKSMVRTLVPGLPVVVASPVEIDDIARTMNPDRDLVVCASWSGTTADMVQFAKDIYARNIVAVGITEKPFSDMALILRKSGGVIPVYSGEEVTVSAVKSILCMLFGMEGFCLALLAELGYRETAEFLKSRMRILPEKIQEVLEDEALRGWSRMQSRSHKYSICHLILDTRHNVGTGPEIALKLEENTWYSMGKTFDFRDMEKQVFAHWDKKNLVLVNATNMVRMQEALVCMEFLHQADIDYALVTFEHEYLEHMRRLGGATPAILPKVDDALQPFVDLVFHMQFGLDFGLAHGRQPGEFPRNRAKSVTAGRSRPISRRGAGRAIADLSRKNEKWMQRPDFRERREALKEPSAWENRGDIPDWESAIYRDMRLLCGLLAEEDALEQVMMLPDKDFSELAGFILDQLAVDGEIVLVPLDKAAESAARTVAKYWTLLLDCFIRIESPAARLHTEGGDRLVIVLAVEKTEDYVLEKILPDLKENFFWIGPGLEKRFAEFFIRQGAYAPLQAKDLHCSQDLLYAAVFLFFTRILRERRPDRAKVLLRHFAMAGFVVSALLNDRGLYQQIIATNDENRDYATALFIGPATGNGPAWVRRFDRHGKRLLEAYDFGFAAHGPLVTVDNQVGEKFVSISGRQTLAEAYGEEMISLWEEKYFRGSSVDTVMSRPEAFKDCAPVSAFFAQKQGFLPELRPDYDSSRDNLVIIDAASERSFGQALDELATFGCRFARMTVISQGAFASAGRLAALNPHPVSHLLLIPDTGEPVSDCLLPFVQTLLSAAMAAGSCRR
ncbi:MAG: SIS domain-containing protein [Desulfobacteraceae bacterium]|nr:SIS domain-containing protein [Desulfobacteraceae bacterium]